MNRIHIIFLLLGFLLSLQSCKADKKTYQKDDHISIYNDLDYNLNYSIRPATNEANQPIPVLVLLHGLGSNELDMLNLAQYFDKYLMVVCLQAPFKIGDQKYSWFDFKLNGGNFIYDIDQLNGSIEKVLVYIDKLKTEYNLDSKRVYIGGFSQGAIMSLGISLRHSDKFAGALILSGDLFKEFEKEVKSIEINPSLSIYMSHGRNDRILPFAEAKKDALLLQDLGVNLESFWFDSKHTISQENYMSMINWMTKQLN